MHICLLCCRYIVSDCDSLDVIFWNQKYTKSQEETAALTLNSGKLLNISKTLMVKMM